MAGYCAHAAGRRDADDGIRTTSSSGQFIPPLLHKKYHFVLQRYLLQVDLLKDQIASSLVLLNFQSQLIDRLNLKKNEVLFMMTDAM